MLDAKNKETYQKWKSLVNMSKSELEKFYNSPEGKVAGLTASQAKKAGIDSGRESARWIMKMKDTSVSEWTPAMWKWANKQISFISRMSGMKGGLYDDKGRKTRKHTSLLIWGHNPEKYGLGGKIKLLAPNGKPSNLTPEQYKLVRTPEFKAWFGDWENDPDNASKVVDENGEPMVVYRGFNKKSDKGNVFKYGVNRFKSNRLANRFGHYFTVSKKVAIEYAEQGEMQDDSDIIVKPYFLNIRNLLNITKSNPLFPKFDDWKINKEPIFEYSLYDILEKLKKRQIPAHSYIFSDVFDSVKDEENLDELSEAKIKLVENKISSQEKELRRIYNDSYKISLSHLVKLISKKSINSVLKKDDFDLIEANENRDVYEWFINFKPSDVKVMNDLDLFLKKLIIDNKYDGGKYKEFQFGVKRGVTDDVYFCFESNQIKLADGTNTTFDASNPDIRFEDGGKVGQEITCVNCGWHWNTNDSDESDKYICHKCNFDNRTFYDNEPIGKYHLGGDMSKHLAPNGKPSNLNHEQWHLVRTPEFKAWFGDWENDPDNASKVVDENGEPMVVYHGTRTKEPFYEFDFNKADLGFHFGTLQQAKKRASSKLKIKSYQSTVSAYFLNIKKLFEVSDVGEWQYTQRYIGMLIEDNIVNKNELRESGIYQYSISDNSKVRSFLKEKYGNGVGFVYENQYEGDGNSFIVLSEEQIKLADGKNTTFDVGNPDIRFKDGGTTVAQTPAPKSERIKGSSVNKQDSSKDTKTAKAIKFDVKTLLAIKNKVDEHNKAYPQKKITLAAAKAVVRRGMGAYSSSHRPTIKGGKPNSRTAWGLARLNAFTYKAINGKSKSGKYTQDDDLLEELGISHKKFEDGGLIESALKKVQSKEMNADDAAMFIYDNGIEVDDELYGKLRQAESDSKKTSNFQVGDTVIVKGKHGNQDFEANYRGASPNGKHIVFPNRNSGFNNQMIVDESEIVKKYKDGGEVRLLAPNGKPSNLTPEQYNLVRTPQFKAWFGDWENDPANASKVVDENGEPMVVYHGTASNFNEFKVGRTGGIFFTNNKSSAERFSTGDLKRLGENPKVIECFLNIKKYYDNKTNHEELIDEYYTKYFQDRPFIKKSSQKNILKDKYKKYFMDLVSFGIVNEEPKKILISYNYDGIVIDADNNSKSYIVFKPNQIKLSNGMNTMFDASNPDIRLEDGGTTVSKPTMFFWHGGNLDEYDDVIAQKNGRYEYGAGLYLTTKWDVAAKYAKGSRKMYKVEVETGVDINDSYLPMETFYNFINKYIIASKKKEVKQRIDKHNKEGKAKAYIFNNIILNEKAIKSTNTSKLREFYVENGIDYEIVNNAFGWGEDMMVLYNMKKIVGTKVISPKEKIEEYDLKPINDKRMKDFQGGVFADGGELSSKQMKIIESPAFLAWFGDYKNDPEAASKVVTEDGLPMVVYHGTTHDFYEFTKERGNPQNAMGVGYYFSSSLKDVENNYLTDGADLTNRIETLAERMVANDEEEDYEEAKKKAAKELKGKKRRIIKVFLSMKNPIDLRPRKMWFEPMETYNEETDEYEENEDSNSIQLREAMLSVDYNFEGFGSWAENAWNELSEQFNGFMDEPDAYSVYEAMKSLPSLADLVDEQGNLANHEYIRQVFEEMGYDGVIMDADLMFGNKRKQGKKMIMDEGTIHFVVFDSNQIKLADGKNTTFDAGNPDIRYAIGGIVSRPKAMMPKVRGGWTKEKIIKYMKQYPTDTASTYTLANYISKFDNWEDFKNHIYYHGTSSYIAKGLKPSIVFSEKFAEQSGGGGYGERYFGISLTKRKRTAESFSGMSRSVDIYPVILKKDAIVIERTDLSDASEIEDIIVELYEQGVDAVWIGGGEEELVLVNPYAAIFYKSGRDSYQVYGGFKSKPLTDEEIKTIYDNSKQIFEEIKLKLSEAKDKESRESVLASIKPFKFEDGGATEFGKVASASSRFRPKEYIAFDPPLIGLNGNKLTGYKWAYEWTMLPNWEGEMVSKRVSDWTQAEISADTGRDIVHQYDVTTPEGTKTVSSESVPILLGYTNRAAMKSLPKIATAAKTLAQQKLKLSILEAQYAQYEAAKADIIKKGFPPVVKGGIEDLGFVWRKDIEKGILKEEDAPIVWKMGESQVWERKEMNRIQDKPNSERLQSLQSNYVVDELVKRGFPRSVFYSTNIYDLKNRIARQERKIKQILQQETKKSENEQQFKTGGMTGQLNEPKTVSQVARKHRMSTEELMLELIEGIKVEMEHTSDAETAKQIALDHLDESPKYYTALREMEEQLKIGNIDDYYGRIKKRFADGGTVDAIYSFKTPTGEPSKLSYIQQVLVRTKSFKDFFGDWEMAAKKFIQDGRENFEYHYKNVSKVLNMITLEPLVVYHGTRTESEFFEFDVTRKEGIGRPYAYFADNIEYATNFTKQSQRGANYGKPYLYEVFLNIRKPFFALGEKIEQKYKNEDYWISIIAKNLFYDRFGKDFNAENATEDSREQMANILVEVESQIGQYAKSVYDNSDYPFWRMMAGDVDKKFKTMLMLNKFDGVRYGEEFQSLYDPNDRAQYTRAWVIFDALQVKLADGRNLNFDPFNIDIRMEKGGKLDNADVKSEVKSEVKLDKIESMKAAMGIEDEKFADGGRVHGDGASTTNAKDGGFFKGKSHADGGIKAVNTDTGQIIEVEGNEVIINKRSVADNTKREFEGEMLTNREILSRINQSGGGVAFADGGELKGNCGCTGKKYKFGGETLEDFLILNKLNGLSETIKTPMEEAREYVDDFLSRINSK